MRASLRIHSLLGLAVFIAWGLIAHARERISSPEAVTGKARSPQTRAGPSDPKLWN
jgi:hypothetical protein